LVAVVPQGDNDGGMTVLLRDALLSKPMVKLSDGTQCPVGLHYPVVLQKAGYCVGDCSPLNVSATLAAPMAAKVANAAINPTLTTGTTLTWLPLQESIELENLPATTQGPHQSTNSFSFGGGAARVDPDCLGEASSCPIVARFTIDVGTVHACNLSQYTDENGTKHNAGFVVLPFESIGSVPKGQPLAETYGVEIDTQMQAPLVITARNFAGGRILRQATLYPDTNGWIAIMVANVAVPRDMQTCGLHAGATHSAAIYDLAKGSWPAAARLVPHFSENGAVDDLQSLETTCGDFLSYQSAAFALLGDYKPEDMPSDPANCKPPGMVFP
jgi:hypothetical protein